MDLSKLSLVSPDCLNFVDGASHGTAANVLPSTKTAHVFKFSSHRATTTTHPRHVMIMIKKNKKSASWGATIIDCARFPLLPHDHRSTGRPIYVRGARSNLLFSTFIPALFSSTLHSTATSSVVFTVNRIVNHSSLLLYRECPPIPLLSF